MDVHLLDLPEHVLHDAFQHLDTWSLCQAAQTCRLFLRLAGLHLGTAYFFSSYLVGQLFVRIHRRALQGVLASGESPKSGQVGLC